VIFAPNTTELVETEVAVGEIKVGATPVTVNVCAAEEVTR
jgi:hypothetical protein